MKIIVTGCGGQLGFDTAAELERRGHQPIRADIDDFDITNKDEVLSFFEKHMPDGVIHCAAYTAVDKAEDDRERAYKINVDGSENIALASKKAGAELIYISTDYVYNGGSLPHRPTDALSPQNYYGFTKLGGEKAVMSIVPESYIVRTSWVFGKNGNNFVKTMLRLSESKNEISVVNDQTGSPTYTADLAKLLCDMIFSRKFGIYNASNEGFCSWAEFAAEIMKQAGKSTVIKPIPTSQYPTRAARPLNSKLDKSCLDEAGFCRLPAWQDALGRYLGEIL